MRRMSVPGSEEGWEIKNRVMRSSHNVKFPTPARLVKGFGSTRRHNGKAAAPENPLFSNDSDKIEASETKKMGFEREAPSISYFPAQNSESS
jgi:hypothetical protein